MNLSDSLLFSLMYMWRRNPSGRGWESGNGFVTEQAGEIYPITGNVDFDGKTTLDKAL
jgi:hypothetical protein